jgi:hypothetical protein
LFGRNSFSVSGAVLRHVFLVEVEDVDDDGSDSSHQESEEDCESRQD